MVPGKSAYPVGKIALEVAFGDDHDSRSETLTFEVEKINVGVKTGGSRVGGPELCV